MKALLFISSLVLSAHLLGQSANKSMITTRSWACVDKIAIEELLKRDTLKFRSTKAFTAEAANQLFIVLNVRYYGRFSIEYAPVISVVGKDGKVIQPEVPDSLLSMARSGKWDYRDNKLKFSFYKVAAESQGENEASVIEVFYKIEKLTDFLLSLVKIK